MKKTFIPLFVGLLCWTSAQAATLTYSYDGGITAAQNGTALQAAINAASAGDELKVQAGTYIGNFSMREGVNVSGGWNEGFTAQTDYATVLDAQSNGRVLNQSENYNTLTVWSNMTIQNGRFTAQQTDKAGAGVFLCDKGQVKHCLIQNNLFDAASGEASGGGVYENGYTTSVLVDDCIIRGNTASHGGGVRICGVIQNSIIEGNTTTINACGGVQLHYGGAMYNCIVRNNTGKDTGGVRMTGGKACTMANCLIVGNTATGTIGGVSVEGGIQNIYNCTIVANNQKSTNNTGRCGVRINVNADAPFYNNIVYGNMVNNVVQGNQLEFHATYLSDRAVKVFKNNAVGYSSEVGTNNILLTSTDPGFTDAANNDYTLLSTSNLVDAGDNTKAQGMHDLAGNARISGTTVDLGCYEYQYPVIADNYVHSDEDIQEAIDATVAGETVYVEAGTYYGNFTMKDGVNVSGGWDATFENQTDYATILDAQNSGRVLTQSAAFNTLTIWSNLTIQNGNVTGTGGGVSLCKNGQLNHCKVMNNACTTQGGGVYCDDTNAGVIIDDCIISGNTAYQGGGMRIRGTVQNSVIENNTVTDAGGGIHLQAAIALNCEVRNNQAKAGAGIRAYGGTVQNCIVENNATTTSNTGGVMLQSGAAMYNSIIRNNTSNENTGGVRLTYDNSKSCTIANCLIVGNSAAQRVGGMALEGGVHYAFGNTIVNNSQTSSSNPDWCGVRVNVGGPLQFCNNIVWGNKANNEVQASQIMLLSSYGNQKNNFVHNAVVWNGKLAGGEDFEGVNTILLDKDTDPGFTDAAHGDYTLAYPSELIDSGHGGYFHETTDLAGNARKVGTIDRGCYEYTYAEAAEVVYNRATTAGRYGTICLPYAVEVANITGAQPYKVLSFSDAMQTGLILEEADVMEAGKPYFFLASADNVSFGYTVQGQPAAAGHEGGLYGTIAGTDLEGEGLYVLQNNELHPATSGAITLAANRAYVKLEDVPEYTPQAPSPRRRVIGIHNATNTTTAIETITNNQSLITGKFIKDGQLIIIRDGKTYNAQGQMVK
jgi:parallel beta-helix repeat protein